MTLFQEHQNQCDNRHTFDESGRNKHLGADRAARFGLTGDRINGAATANAGNAKSGTQNGQDPFQFRHPTCQSQKSPVEQASLRNQTSSVRSWNSLVVRIRADTQKGLKSKG